MTAPVPQLFYKPAPAAASRAATGTATVVTASYDRRGLHVDIPN
ncbi:MAG: hypothetical protein ABJQ90_16380 [Parasphingorhabdus sp.]